MKKLILPTILLIYIAAMGFTLFTPSPGNIPLPDGSDKIIHFAEFFILTILLTLTFSVFGFEKKILLTAALAITIAVASELIQIPIHSRDFSLLDLLADMLGILSALLIFVWRD